MMRLEGKTALITGATGGIGAACAKWFASEGARIVFSGRDEAKGALLLAEIDAAGGKAAFIQADLCKDGACDALVAQAVENLGRIDILVNNAAIIFAAPTDETTDEMWDQTFAVNVTAVFRMARAAIRQMKAQGGGGAIVNTGSEAGINGEPGLSAYWSAP